MQMVRTQLVAAVPGDWAWKESLTLLAGSGEANVIFSSEPLDPDIDLDRYTGVQGELLQSEFPGYREMAFEPMRMMGQRNGYMRRFAWNPSDAPEVTQIQLYCVDGSRGYTATATTPTASFRDLEPILVDVLQRLTLAGAPGAETMAGEPVTAQSDSQS